MPERDGDGPRAGRPVDGGSPSGQLGPHRGRPGLLERLDELSPAQRLLVLRNLDSNRRRELVVRLLASCRSAGFEDPDRSLLLASLALEAVEVRAGERRWLALRAEALGDKANALRRVARFAAARGAWEEVERLGRNEELPLPLRGRLLSLRASLATDEERLDEAERDVAAADACFLRSGERGGRLRVGLHQAILLNARGEVERALRAAWSVVAGLAPSDPPRLRLVALHNFAIYAVTIGEIDCGEQVFQLAAPLYRPQSGAVRLRSDWLRAQLLVGRGEVAAGRRILAAARSSDAGRRDPIAARVLDEQLAELADPPAPEASARRGPAG